MNSAIKYVRTWAMIATRGWYSMSNWLNSMAHRMSCLAASVLFIVFLISWSVMTMIGVLESSLKVGAKLSGCNY